MTQDEIIEMACQAFGGVIKKEERDNFIAFAKLVAERERERLTDAAMKAAEKAVDLAIALEREACALVADEAIDFWVKRSYPESAEVREAQNIAESIRARRQA